MRSVFTTPPATLSWYTVEWPSSSISWEDFRGKVLGSTDPKTAEEGSIRRAIYDNWKDLKLKQIPNVGDNGVHASARYDSTHTLFGCLSSYIYFGFC